MRRIHSLRTLQFAHDHIRLVGLDLKLDIAHIPILKLWRRLRLKYFVFILGTLLSLDGLWCSMVDPVQNHSILEVLRLDHMHPHMGIVTSLLVDFGHLFGEV